MQIIVEALLEKEIHGRYYIVLGSTFMHNVGIKLDYEANFIEWKGITMPMKTTGQLRRDEINNINDVYLKYKDLLPFMHQ